MYVTSLTFRGDEEAGLEDYYYVKSHSSDFWVPECTPWSRCCRRFTAERAMATFAMTNWWAGPTQLCATLMSFQVGIFATESRTHKSKGSLERIHWTVRGDLPSLAPPVATPSNRVWLQVRSRELSAVFCETRSPAQSVDDQATT